MVGSTLAEMNTLNPTLPSDFNVVGHARIKDTIWGVYHGNPHLLCRMPATSDAPPPRHAQVKANNFWYPSYVATETVYIIFIPACNPWYGALRALDYKLGTLPIEETPDGTWRLEESVTETWYELELGLLRVLYTMMEVTKLPIPQMTVFGSPYRFGYKRSYRTERAARAVAFRSIHAFLPLIGHLAMYFWYMAMGLKDMPDWQDRV
ncbi:hypothetical protein B0H11DRAFT_1937778, partial [Mycena galericulata]